MVIERLLGNRRRLQEVNAPGQEIVWHLNPSNTAACRFHTLSFVQIKQRCNVSIHSELQRCW